MDPDTDRADPVVRLTLDGTTAELHLDDPATPTPSASPPSGPPGRV